MSNWKAKMKVLRTGIKIKKLQVIMILMAKQNNLSSYEKKEEAHNGYVCIDECSKHFCRSTYEHACKATAISISQMEEHMTKYKDK